MPLRPAAVAGKYRADRSGGGGTIEGDRQTHMAWVLQTASLKVPDTEVLIDSGPRQALMSDSFCFAVTKEAVYLPVRKKGFVLRDAFETTRVPLSAIRGVALRPARAVTTRIVTWTVIVLVLALAFLADTLKTRKWSFGLLFLTVVYLYSLVAMIFGPRGRYRVQIDMWPQPLEFVPRLESIISSEAKAAELENQTQFLDACRRAGLSVINSRDSPTPDKPPATGV